ncbi:acyl-CoA dehydrogenase family protein [Variovorax sp. ZS18.2.2]|uniref:acyl-CoA dehydrogenase family protein n=1 Tax=Variovorax sp. ZS18.2.2 TaxID=2971255 RepID=UPI002151597E|nr:acyl-CoA dehydrogenase family protein [Variovorax sp. ZS18.2.2]MCR6480862.1 acyl-CoA dehydrogenase family protein [Variovorax sp. ZS18.2.2]
MTLFDPSILRLPFYEERHHALAADLEAWVERHRQLPHEHRALDVEEKGRVYTRLLGEAGWLRHAVEADSGRQRPDVRSLCLIREALAFLDDLLDFAFSIQGLAAAPLAWYGSPEQRACVIPAMREGRSIGALALSESESGSNLAALKSQAVREGAGYVLDGTKTWISNGPIADHHAVLARTGEGPGGLGLSFLWVPASTSGLRTERIDLLAPRAFSSLHFSQCLLPATALIGEPGKGFIYATEILDLYRVSVGAAALGFCRRAMRCATDWSRQRNVAGSKLIQTQFTIEKLSGMSLHLDTTALLVARAAWEFDTGVRDVAAHASMAKLHATDGASRVVDDVVQLFGAAGLVADSEPEQLFRQIRALRIYEGTSEIQKMIIAGAVSRPPSR